MTLIAFPLTIEHTETESIARDQRGEVAFRGPDMFVIDMVVGVLNAKLYKPTRGRKKMEESEA